MIAMLAWTWGGWPDPLVDFGRELYMPWQLSLGKVLYRDIAHLNGPLSAYFNALLFRLFGVSLRTLVLANIAIAAIVSALIWNLFRAAGGELSATVAGILFVTLFMTVQFVDVGNYNWICPYSHELTHGLTLTLAAIAMIVQYTKRPRPYVAGIVGLLIGYVLAVRPPSSVARERASSPRRHRA